MNDATTTSITSTGLTAPAWATEHQLEDGAVIWRRTVELPVGNGERPVARVSVATSDAIEDTDGGVRLIRDETTVSILGGDSMTLTQASQLAAAITDAVDAVKAADRLDGIEGGAT